jgi:hypothetical protein
MKIKLLNACEVLGKEARFKKRQLRSLSERGVHLSKATQLVTGRSHLSLSDPQSHIFKCSQAAEIERSFLCPLCPLPACLSSRPCSELGSLVSLCSQPRRPLPSAPFLNKAGVSAEGVGLQAGQATQPYRTLWDSFLSAFLCMSG